MEMDDDLFDGLFETTQKILDAAEQPDIEMLGKAIDERQKYMSRLSPQVRRRMTDGQRTRLNETILLDRKATAAVNRLFAIYKNEIRNSRVKYDGLIKYNNINYNLASGRLIDKKR